MIGHFANLYTNFQVRISIRGQTSARTIPSPSEFVKFLKTDESLHSFYVSECELYCLANILGLPLNTLTWSGQVGHSILNTGCHPIGNQ